VSSGRGPRLVRAALSGAVVVAGAAALLAGVVVPRLAGATPLTVTTGSMEPAVPKGALAVVRPAEQIGLGDVITFQLESGKPETATHRVVGVGITGDGEPAFATKGDANQVADLALVRAEQVKGKLWYAVPWLGYVASLLDPDQRVLAVVVVAALLSGFAVVLVGLAAAGRRRAKAEGVRGEPVA
jgi:signal peptidase